MVLGSFCSKKDKKFKTVQPKSLRITGVQKGFIQCLEIYQSIQTKEDLDQVSYIFPTDNNLCIYNMKFQVGDETITAELRTQKAAEETFKEAKKIGRTAAMTEQIAPGITSVKIGNVPKNKDVAIIFQCVLTSTLQNPTTILTKIPLQASEPDGSLTDLYNLPSLEINIDLNISQAQQISDVYTNCESNYTKSDLCNGKLTINSAIITDENILIMTEFSEPIQSQMIQTNNSAVISVIPDFESKKSTKKEFVFLIDCSASMLGESIRKAKESLHLFLAKLPKDSYFNIICFGTTFKKLFDHSQTADQISIEKAAEFVDSIRANLGGTEMLQLFDELFKDEVKTAGQRQIFIITDGEVYERQKVIQKVEENSYFNRIFAIGLGHGADAGFLEEITSMTNGKSDFVFNKDELPSKVAEHFELSLFDGSTDNEIHIEGTDSFEVVPYPLPPLLPHVVRHLFVSGTGPQPAGAVMISGKVGGQDIESVISKEIDMTINEGEKSPIYALFAQKQLKKIENDEANQEKCIKLSLASGVLSKYTSYIAVTENGYVEEEQQPVETVEESAPECCSSIRYCMRVFESTTECCSLGSPSYAPMSPCFMEACCAAAPPPPPCCAPVMMEACCAPHPPPPPPRPAAPPPCDEPPSTSESTGHELHEEEAHEKDPWEADASAVDIVRLQSRDGFWDLPSSFITNKAGGKLPEIGIDLSESPIVRKRAISTVFTLGYLMKFLGDSSGKWRFAKEKGLKWLKRIESSVNWDQIIAEIIESISK
ncbi:von Willebrand factor A domain-containing protein 5A [Tritrichomonas musculus]|uniref:von Willebrand factor A domain-containing protein 5A n=1 Tax=Tritrichomonas musculus TaxID=1915356 RepID=A0ABR2J1V4_9EUKA